jgi:hypothetical protein
MNRTFITSIDPCAGGLGEARALNAPRFANVPQWGVWGNPPNPGFCQRTTHFFLKSYQVLLIIHNCNAVKTRVSGIFIYGV